MIKDDYLIRMIRRASDAISRALGKQQQEGDEQTASEIHDALGDVVNLPVATLVMLDVDSLLPLMGGGDKGAARVVARALAALADIDERRTQAADAKQKRAAAIAIYTRVGIGTDAVDRDVVRALTGAAHQAKPRG